MRNPILQVLAMVFSLSGLQLCAQEPAVPQRLQVLLDGYENEKRRVLEPVERKLDAALQALRVEFTRAGRLEDALAVSKLIEEREAVADPVSDTRWDWKSGGQLELNGDGTAEHTLWEKRGFWERQKDGTIRLLSDDGGYVITFSDKDNGTVVALRGGATAIRKIEAE